MQVYRYSRWDGTQEIFPLHEDDLMEQLSENLMVHSDLSASLRSMTQQGLRGRFGERIKGIQDLLQQLRNQRQQKLNQYNVDSVLEEIQKQLQEIVQTERQGIQRRLDEAQERYQQSLSRQSQRAEPSAEQPSTPELPPQLQEQLLRKLEQQARQHLEYLASLPKDPAGAVNQLRNYEFMDPQAKQLFDELLKRLQRQVANTYIKNLSQQLQSMSPEQMEALKQFVKDLNRLLEDKIDGKETNFDQFMQRYGQLFGPNPPKDVEELVQELQRQTAQMQSLLDSLSPEQRQTLQDLFRSAIKDPELQDELAQLATNLDYLHPLGSLRREYPFQGDESLTLEEAMRLMASLQNLDELEKQLRRSQQGAPLEEISQDLLKESLGEEALQALEQLKNLSDVLEQAGYIRKVGARYELTPKGMRKLGQKALQEIFTHLRKDRQGGHLLEHRGQGGEGIEESKSYEFGDPFHLDMKRTLSNAIERTGPGVPVRLQPQDFEVYQTERLTRASTVLMLDLSLSMAMRGNFLAAKKVAMALDGLIRSQFPRDILHIVGFSTYAREIKPEKLPHMSWDEFDPYTNIQHGLILAQRMLAKAKGTNKQIILISDGEPTAHLEGGQLFLQYPPSPRTIRETLKEVKHCTQQGIVLNTFMLDRNTYLMDFVEQLTKLNGGRVFFTTPDRLGQYILVDYLASRRRKLIL
jgi:uncharacterized protein with von Willebrand factor type A (vWA) domain